MRPWLWLLLPVTLPVLAGQACVDCHKGAAERSYALSKHGIIAGIEIGRMRQRTPDCVACHAYEAKAAAPQHYANEKLRTMAQEQAASGCGRCHSPRYVTEQQAAAQRALAIGEMKRREAKAVVETARREMTGEALARIEKLFATLCDQDMQYLRLGLAHQSPDYQWWFGQAALDGSLLRIKGALGEARRSRVASTLPAGANAK